jgi:integrative and conjugative element protein (TIGR02256 family)
VSRLWPGALTTPTHDRYVLVDPSVRTRLELFLNADTDRCEAGGLLLGLRRGLHLEILDLTLPGRGDRRYPMRFERRCRSHQASATAAWRRSEGFIDYLGEWHTHLETDPTPSSIDRSSLRQRSRAHRGEPLAELIIGWRSIAASLVVDGVYLPLRSLPASIQKLL